MEPDDFATFRAAHSTVMDAIEKCERPDWIVRLVWDAVSDHKAALKFGAHVAAVVRPGKGSNAFVDMKPRPMPLEAIDVWTNRTTPEEHRRLNTARAFKMAALPAALVAILIDRFALAHALGFYPRVATMCGMVLVFAIVFAQPIKLYFARAVEREVANVDPESALQTILREIAIGMKRNPRFVPVAMRFIRRTARDLVTEQPT